MHGHKTPHLPFRYFLALLWAHPILHISTIRVKFEKNMTDNTLDSDYKIFFLNDCTTSNKICTLFIYICVKKCQNQLLQISYYLLELNIAAVSSIRETFLSLLNIHDLSDNIY